MALEIIDCVSVAQQLNSRPPEVWTSICNLLFPAYFPPFLLLWLGFHACFFASLIIERLRGCEAQAWWPAHV
jgi:hypothetical protein